MHSEGHHLHIPWMNRNIKTKMRKQCIQKSKENLTPLLWKKYTSLRNEVITILRKPRREHLRKVSRQGCKQFWKTVKYFRRASSQIPTLKTDSTVASSKTAKASLLNEVLSQNFNFNTTVPPLTETDYHVLMADTSSPYPEEICTEEDVFNLLIALDISKASGSDGIYICN